MDFYEWFLEILIRNKYFFLIYSQKAKPDNTIIYP